MRVFNTKIHDFFIFREKNFSDNLIATKLLGKQLRKCPPFPQNRGKISVTTFFLSVKQKKNVQGYHN